MSDYGFLSVVPPLLALVLAFKTKDVLLSLFSGVIVGVFILSHGNPYTALIIFWQDIIFKQLTDAWVAELLILMTLIGGFTALLEASGGVEALTSKFKSLAGSRAKVQVAAWLGGLALFFFRLRELLDIGSDF